MLMLLCPVKLPKIETNFTNQTKPDADDAPQSVIHVPEGFKAFVCRYNEDIHNYHLTIIECWRRRKPGNFTPEIPYRGV